MGVVEVGVVVQTTQAKGTPQRQLKVWGMSIHIYLEGLGTRTTTINLKSDMLKTEFEKVQHVNFHDLSLGTVRWKPIEQPLNKRLEWMAVAVAVVPRKEARHRKQRNWVVQVPVVTGVVK